MEAHALNIQATTPFLEFGCSVTGSHAPQVREKWARRRQVAQYAFNIFTETDESQFSSLFSLITDDMIFPVNVFGFQERNIRLRCAKVPSQLVKGSAVCIVLPCVDGTMLLQGDGSLVLERKTRPHPFWNHRHGQPVHSERKIMNPTEVDVGAYLAFLHRPQEVLGTGFQQRERSQSV